MKIAICGLAAIMLILCMTGCREPASVEVAWPAAPASAPSEPPSPTVDGEADDDAQACDIESDEGVEKEEAL